jgi:hypothetical protein
MLLPHSLFLPIKKKMCKGYMLYIKNWEYIQYTKHGMLTLMFMKKNAQSLLIVSTLECLIVNSTPCLLI